MYGNSGNIWFIIISVLIGAVIVFLITREFWCWYWKINRLVALMEEQNYLLKEKLGFDIVNSPVQIPSKFANENTPKDHQIIIRRVKSNFGTAVAVDLVIDEQPNLQLFNEEEKTVAIANGKHIIVAKYYNDTCKVEFEINNNTRKIDVFVEPKLKIEMVY